MMSIFVVLTTVKDSMQLAAAPQRVTGDNIYIVLWVTLLIWFGIFFYLFYLDRKIQKISLLLKLHMNDASKSE